MVLRAKGYRLAKVRRRAVRRVYQASDPRYEGYVSMDTVDITLRVTGGENSEESRQRIPPAGR